VSDTIDVAELLAIGTDATIAFGNKNANANDSTTATLDNVYNYGNVQMDFAVNTTTAFSGTGDCGGLVAQYLKVNITNTAQATYQAGYPLKTTLGGPNGGGTRWDTNQTANVTVTTEYPQATIQPTYWGIGIPGGVSGSCSTYVWFAAMVS